MKSEQTSKTISTGEQGQISEAVIELAGSIEGSGEELVNNIAQYIKSLKPIKTSDPDFSRTADQIIISGEQWGCHEAGLVFATIMRAKGEQVTYIQAFKRDDLITYTPEYPGNIAGHVFLRWKMTEGEKFINSTTGKITEEIPEKYVYGVEGLDSWDAGLRNGLKDYLPAFVKTKLQNGL